jgi:F1F0 ATPase subunit 2
MPYLFLLLFSLLAGGAIGLFYFGGLWWTVRRMPDAQTPVILLMGSFMLRSVVAVTAFYLVAADWVTLVTAVIGFLIARFALVRYWGPEETHGH